MPRERAQEPVSEDPAAAIARPNGADRSAANDLQPNDSKAQKCQIEIGGPKGLEPTRYGDWERAGRCIDF